MCSSFLAFHYLSPPSHEHALFPLIHAHPPGKRLDVTRGFRQRLSRRTHSRTFSKISAIWTVRPSVPTGYPRSRRRNARDLNLRVRIGRAQSPRQIHRRRRNTPPRNHPTPCVGGKDCRIASDSDSGGAVRTTGLRSAVPRPSPSRPRRACCHTREGHRVEGTWRGEGDLRKMLPCHVSIVAFQMCRVSGMQRPIQVQFHSFSEMSQDRHERGKASGLCESSSPSSRSISPVGTAPSPGRACGAASQYPVYIFKYGRGPPPSQGTVLQHVGMRSRLSPYIVYWN